MDSKLKELLTSKKFRTALIAIVLALASKLGLRLDDTTVGILISPLIAYIIGQAQVDKAAASSLPAPKDSIT